MTEPGGVEKIKQAIRSTELSLTNPVNRTGVEAILFSGSSIPTSDPLRPYNTAQLIKDGKDKSIPPFLMAIEKKPASPDEVARVKADRAKGISGMMHAFTNVHVEVGLPPINDEGESIPDWPVRAGKDGKETPVLDEQYGDIAVIVLGENGVWHLRFK